MHEAVQKQQLSTETGLVSLNQGLVKLLPSLEKDLLEVVP
jgi:hypothetical protein